MWNLVKCQNNCRFACVDVVVSLAIHEVIGEVTICIIVLLVGNGVEVMPNV